MAGLRQGLYLVAFLQILIFIYLLSVHFTTTDCRCDCPPTFRPLETSTSLPPVLDLKPSHDETGEDSTSIIFKLKYKIDILANEVKRQVLLRKNAEIPALPFAVRRPHLDQCIRFLPRKYEMCFFSLSLTLSIGSQSQPPWKDEKCIKGDDSEPVESQRGLPSASRSHRRPHRRRASRPHRPPRDPRI